MPKPDASSAHVKRSSARRWVPIAKMRVSPVAQRQRNQARVDYLAANFDPDEIGYFTVNFRDGHYWVMDGQHRMEALKAIGYGDQQVECDVYEGLTVEEEAEKFLKLSDTLTISAFDKFQKGVVAGRPVEVAINRVVLDCGCAVSRTRTTGAIKAVGTLRKVYARGGDEVLGRTLKLILAAYGDAGLDAAVMDGIGHLCQRYNGSLDDERAVKQLGNAHGGVNGLLNRADGIRRKSGNAKGQCIAAAAVEILNAGRGGKKLPDWWKA